MVSVLLCLEDSNEIRNLLLRGRSKLIDDQAGCSTASKALRYCGTNGPCNAVPVR